MLFRLVRPTRRSGSRNRYCVRRILSDVRRQVAGATLAIPIGDSIRHLTITPRTQAMRVSLRIDEPAEVIGDDLRCVRRDIIWLMIILGALALEPEGQQMSKDEFVLQLAKVALGILFGTYFLWWSLEVLHRLPAP